MPKQIPILLLEAYQKWGRSTCFCIKLVAKDGTVQGFTSLDKRIFMDDGIHQFWCSPYEFMEPQNIENTIDVSEPDNTELHGTFSDDFEQLMLAGKFFSAEVSVYRVTYLKMINGYEVVAYGRLGKVDYQADKGGSRKLEWLGLDDVLSTNQNDVTSLTCRNTFGGLLCTKPLIWEDYVIAELDDPQLRFRVTGPTHPDPLYFLLGVIRFNEGPNETAELEIEEWEPTVDGGWVKLSFVAPYPAVVGDGVSNRQDCDKTETTCKGTYNNVINMNAEHLMPVQDTSLMIPGAYVKSNNALPDD